LAIVEHALGADSPQAAGYLVELADVARRDGRHADAVAYAERAAAIRGKIFGEGGTRLAEALRAQAEALVASHRAADAIAPADRAVASLERADVDPADRARARFVLARALWDGGGDRDRAKSLASAARDDLAGAERDTHELGAEIGAWLHKH